VSISSADAGVSGVSGGMSVATESATNGESGSVGVSTGTAVGGAGGAISVSVGSGNTGTGGGITMTAGETSAAGATGGGVSMTAGKGAGFGGAVEIYGGVGFTSTGGALLLVSGEGTATSSGPVSMGTREPTLSTRVTRGVTEGCSNMELPSAVLPEGEVLITALPTTTGAPIIEAPVVGDAAVGGVEPMTATQSTGTREPTPSTMEPRGVAEGCSNMELPSAMLPEGEAIITALSPFTVPARTVGSFDEQGAFGVVDTQHPLAPLSHEPLSAVDNLSFINLSAILQAHELALAESAEATSTTQFVDNRANSAPTFGRDDACAGRNPRSRPHVQRVNVTELNFKELSDLIQAAGPALTNLEGRDVVALLGSTGSGKSTLIQYIAGKTMVRRNGDRGFEALDPVAGFEIGHSLGKSQTSHLRHFEHAPPSDGASPSLGAAFVDTCGYGDTTNKTRDIATSVCLQKISTAARQLRFVVLIPATALRFGRGGPLRALASLVSNILPGVTDFYSSPHRAAFTFLFTHTDEQADMINQPFEKVRQLILVDIESILDGSDTDSKEYGLLQWLVECLKDDLPYLFVFHPMESDKTVLIPTLEMFNMHGNAGENDSGVQEVLPTAIGMRENEVPGEIVGCSLTRADESKVVVALEQQVRLIREAIALGSFAKVGQLKMELATLKEHMPKLALTYVEKVHEELGRCYKLARDKAYELAARGTEDLSECFSVTNARDALLNCARLDAIAEMHLSPPDAVTGTRVCRYICQQVSALSIRLSNGLQNDEGICTAIPRLQRLKAWADADPHFLSCYNCAVTTLNNVLQGAVTLATECDIVYSPLVTSQMVGALNMLQDAESLWNELPSESGVSDTHVTSGSRGIPVTVKEAIESCIDELKAAADVFAEKAIKAIKTIEDGLDQRDKQFKINSHLLEELIKCLANASSQTRNELVTYASEKERKVVKTLREFGDTQLLLVTKCLSAEAWITNEAGAASTSITTLRSAFVALEAVVDAQSEAQHSESEINDRHTSICSAVSVHVHRIKTKLDELTAEGIGSVIERALVAFATLNCMQWLDSHLQLECRFVVAAATRITTAFREHFCRTISGSLEALETL